MLGYVELFFFPFTLISRCEGYSAQAQGGSPGKAPNRAQRGGAAQVFFFLPTASTASTDVPKCFWRPSGR